MVCLWPAATTHCVFVTHAERHIDISGQMVSAFPQRWLTAPTLSLTLKLKASSWNQSCCVIRHQKAIIWRFVKCSTTSSQGTSTPSRIFIIMKLLFYDCLPLMIVSLKWSWINYSGGLNVIGGWKRTSKWSGNELASCACSHWKHFFFRVLCVWLGACSHITGVEFHL